MSLNQYASVDLGPRWLVLVEQEELLLAGDLEELVCTSPEGNIRSAECSCK